VSIKRLGVELKNDVRIFGVVDEFCPVFCQIGRWDVDPGGLFVDREFRGRWDARIFSNIIA